MRNCRNAEHSRPHTVHYGPEGLSVSAVGGTDGQEGHGGVALLDHDSFDVRSRWNLTTRRNTWHDMWWHLGHDVMVTSEWVTHPR